MGGVRRRQRLTARGVRLAGVGALVGAHLACQAGAGSPGGGLGDRRSLVDRSAIVIGRATATGPGRRVVWLLTDANVLVRVVPSLRRFDRFALEGLKRDETPWGLAILDDGALFTLLTRQRLGELSERGRVVRRTDLPAPQLGVFGWGHRLIYQPAVIDVGHGALTRTPGGDRRSSRTMEPWGSLRIRAHEASRPERLAYNLVACGGGVGPAWPCWFRDGDTVDRIRPDGRGDPVVLAHVSWAPPDAAADLESRRRPIRDVYLLASGGLWTLQEPSDAQRASGVGAQLVGYDRFGAVLGTVELPEPARLILEVDAAMGSGARTASLLSGEGRLMHIELS